MVFAFYLALGGRAWAKMQAIVSQLAFIWELAVFALFLLAVPRILVPCPFPDEVTTRGSFVVLFMTSRT